MGGTLDGVRIGIAMCGSFCTFSESFGQAQLLSDLGCELLPVMSFNASSISSRFGTASENLARLERICNRKAVLTIEDAEPIGPKGLCDVMLVMPCTSNTLAKLCYGITDTPVTMAVKSHLRNGRPVVLAVATNDALGASAKNIGFLLNCRNVYFVPYGQDDYRKKPCSMIAHFDLVPKAVEAALEGRQLQPMILPPL